MKRNKILTLMAAAMTMTACSVSDITDNIPGNGNSVTVESAKVTRASDTQEPEPMTDDFYLINLTQKEKVDDRYDAVFTYNDGTYTSDADVMWCGSGKNNFVAYYPAETKSGQNLTPIANVNRFMIPQNQTNAQDSIADWMRATATASKTDNGGSLSLNFEHMLTQVTIVCDYSDYYDDGEDVTVKVNQIYTRTQYCEVTTDDQRNVTITPYQRATNGTNGIYVSCDATPMENAPRKTSSTVIIAPGEYKAEHDESYSYNGFADAGIYVDDEWNSNIDIDLPQDMTLEAGKHYTFNVVIKGHDAATISAVTVSDWTHATLASGIANKIPYVTFSADAEQIFKMSVSYESYTLPDLEYSVGNGIWAKVVENTTVKFGGTLGTLRLRGKAENGTAESSSKYSTITFTNTDVPVTCTGDIRTLVDYNNYMTVDTQNARFCSLFQDCMVLKTTPELPATTLASYCYKSMFDGCTSLTNAPKKLPATTLASRCYAYMFYGCTSLTTAPELPATTLADYCYSYMFYGCTRLTNAPKLNATTLADYCYSYMFSGCESLTNAPALPATKLASECYSSMFKECTRLTTAPALPATTLASKCYDSMFYKCTSLKNAPTLPAETLVDFCYDSMFNGCTSLTNAPALPAMKLTSSCYANMFSGCTSLTTAPELPATTLANYCYNMMFDGCTRLTNAPELNATTLAEGCYYSMFKGCTMLETAPKLNATTLASRCYYYMFYGCTSLKNAPTLPATTLASECYKRMFGVCTSLESVTMLAPADQITNNQSRFTEWLDNAGTSASARTLKLYNEEAYNSLTNVLPDNWKTGNATIIYENTATQ